MAWVILEPLANVLILLTIFGALHRSVSPSIPYPVFLVTGMLPYFLFRNLAFRGMEAVDANRGLFVYRQVKPVDTLLSRALLEVLLQSVVYTLTLGALALLDYDVVPARPLELIAMSTLLVLLGFSLGLLFAVATHEAPRARTFIRLCGTPLYFLSGVMLSVHALPQELRAWLLWNPVLHLVELSRGSFFSGYPVLPEVSMAYVAAFTLVCLAAGLSLYRLRRQQLLAVA